MKCYKPILEKNHCRGERKKKKANIRYSLKETKLCVGTDLRTNLDVILLIIPVDVPLLACAKAPGS